MEWTTVFTCIMTSLTTIVVTILGLYQSKKAKETEEYRKLREQLDEEKRKEEERKSKEEEERLLALEKSINSVREDVQVLKEDMGKITGKELSVISEQLNHLHTIQIGSFKCIESLSDVVVTIGTTLDDSSAVDEQDKRRLADAISQHKKVNSLVHNELYNIIA